MHGGDWVASVLVAHGVRFLFTLCGGHISPILTGAKRSGIRVVDVRDEATAIFAADAVARLSGVPGVAAVTAGPGVTNTITAIKNAQLAQSPVVILGGAAATALQGRGALQDIDQLALVKPHVKRARAVRRLVELVPVLEDALATARAGVPGPVFVEVPVDLLYDESVVRAWYEAAAGKGRTLTQRMLGFHLRRHVDRMFAGSDRIQSHAPHPSPPPFRADSAARRAAQRLRSAQRPLLLIGSQPMLVAHEVDDLVDAVQALGIPTYLSGMARGLLGTNHPLQRRHRRRDALKAADVVILAGVPCDFRLEYGQHIRRKACLIAANRSPRDLKLNRRPNIAALGDAGLFLRRLAELAPGPGARWDDWDAELRERDRIREQEITEQAHAPNEYCNPVKLCRQLDELLPETSVIVADGGDFVATASYIVHPRGPLTWLDPGVFGTLGVGAGFALGAKLCRPESEVWVLFGDGAFGYGASEFDTFVRHRIPIIALVGNDAAWSQVAREQVKLLDDDVATVLARTDYHRVVEGYGAMGLLLDRHDQLEDAVRQARQATAEGYPALINALLASTAFREGSVSM